MMPDQLPQLLRPLVSFWKQHCGSSKTLPVAVIFITLGLVLIIKAAQPEPPVKLHEEKTWVVQTQRLLGGKKSPHLELYARVESPYTATITASLNADVLSLDVLEGQYVTRGQRLITLDDKDAQLALELRQADVAEMEASIQSEKNRYKNDISALKLEKSLVALAEKKMEREEKTSKTNFTSQSSFDTQKQALQNQKLALKARQLNVSDHPARLSQLEARLAHRRALAQQAQNDLHRATIASPFDGIVLKTMVSPGERVRPGENLLEIYATAQLELRAQLPQRFINIVKQSLADQIPLPATLQTDLDQQVVLLDRISGTIADSNNGVDALFKINSDDVRTFTIGEVMEITLVLPAIDSVFSVPVSSIYGTNRIYLVEDERLVAVKVEKLGSQYKDGRQFILVRSEKLNADDEVITMQLPHALNGLKVEVRNASISSELP
jgi:multidrug resistance efflux pump